MPKRRMIKSKRKTMLRILMLLGILLLIIAGAIATVLLIGNSATPQAQLTTQPFTAGDKFLFTGTGFLYVKDDMIHVDDLANDKNDAAYQIGFGAYDIAGSGSIQMIYNNAAFQILGQNFPKEIAGLQAVKCGSGYIAALRFDTGEVERERIQVFDRAGETLLDQISTDQFIVDYGFYEADNEYLYVVSMSLSGSTPVSTITFYNVTRITTSGVMTVQNQLIEHMCFTKSGIFAVGTNQIIRYALADNRKSYEVTVYGWKLIDFDSSGANPCFLLKPRSGETLGTVKLLQLSDGSVPNETQHMLQLPAGTIAAFIMGGKLVAVTPNNYVLFDLKGQQTGAYQFPVQIEEARKLSGNLLLVRNGSAYYTLRVA